MLHPPTAALTAGRTCRADAAASRGSRRRLRGPPCGQARVVGNGAQLCARVAVRHHARFDDVDRQRAAILRARARPVASKIHAAPLDPRNRLRGSNPARCAHHAPQSEIGLEIGGVRASGSSRLEGPRASCAGASAASTVARSGLMVLASASTERGSNNVKRSKQTARTGARAVGGGAAGASGVAEAGAAARPHAAARAAPPAPRSSSRKRCRCMPWIFPCRQRMVDARPGSEAMHFCRPRAIVPGGARLG